MKKRIIQHGNSDKTREMLRNSKVSDMPCSKCGRLVKCDDRVVSCLCWKCTAKLAPPPKFVSTIEKVEAPTRPHGWALLAVFVDFDGTVYHYGIEKPELKDTLPITDVAKIRADQEAMRAANALRNEERKKKRLEREMEARALAKEKDKMKKKHLLESLVESEPTVSSSKKVIAKNKKVKGAKKRARK